MAITTVATLVAALKKHDQTLGVEALDEGSSTRAFQGYKILSVLEAEVGNDATGYTKKVAVRIAPTA